MELVKMAELKNIKLSQIQEPAIKLRPVLKDSPEYQGIVDSIKRVGVLNAILVREVENTVNPDIKKYEVIEGNHRFNASMDAGLDEIPCSIQNMTEGQIYDAQIIGNIQKIETKPVEYSKQLKAILNRERTLTANELAARLGKSATWLAERLGLTTLAEPIGKMVDDGTINLTNAYALSKLDPEDQEIFKDRAITEDGAQFVPSVNAHVKQKKEALRQGRDPNAVAVYVHTARVQKLSDVKELLADTAKQGIIIRDAKAETVTDGFIAGLNWVLSLDPASVAAGKAKWEADKAASEEKKKTAAAEREAKKAAAAAGKAPADGPLVK